MDFGKFVRIVTEGGTCSEIYSIFDALLDYHKKNSDYDFWKEHENKVLLKQKDYKIE